MQFYGALNDFLPTRHRNQYLTVIFNGDQSYKHLIESLGAPHPEIAFILVNDQRTDLNQIARPDCVVKVFPYDPGDPQIRPINLRFVLDGHLGKLTSYLRILGLDVCYTFDAADETLAAISATESRILLTRDRGLLKRNQVKYGYCIRDQNPRQQLQEVIQRYDLLQEVHPFTRCPHCNGLLQPVEKNAVLERLPANTIRYFDLFWQCIDCQKIYWQGSHYQCLQTWLKGLLANR
jgi:uncharacterized protein with PIN domain